MITAMNLARACNLLLDAALPEWIQLLPAGPDITGQDGRAWTLDDPAALIAAFQQRQTPLVIDWEHASEHRAPQGLDAPAAGWIDRIEERDRALWGHVEWTARAGQQIQEREYRYLSPVFTYRKDTRQIVALTSAGLTNQPNLNLQALNREEAPMPLPVALCQALDLPDTADEALAVARVQTMTLALNTAQSLAAAPPLDKFMPRADYDLVLARATNAETRLADLEKAQNAVRIDALIQRGLTECKISPATQDYYRAMCQTEHGVAEFEKFLDKAPPLIGVAPEGKKPPHGRALNRAAFDALDPLAQREFLRQPGSRVTD